MYNSGSNNSNNNNNDNNNGNNNGSTRKWIFGSLKRFSKKPDEAEASSARSVSPSGPSAARGLGNAPAAAAAAAVRSPLTNPSGPTRRPVLPDIEPPPPYSAVPVDPGSGNDPGPAAAPVAAAAAQSSAAPLSFLHRPASLAPSNRSTSSRLTADNIRSSEDPYALLSMFDTIFVIDDSGSMAGRPWIEVQAVLTNITPICTKRDADGIDIYFLNHKSPSPQPIPQPSAGGGHHHQQEQQQQLRQQQQQQARAPPGKSPGGYYNVRDAATVARIFRTVKPGGGTPTGVRLNTILQPYLGYYEAKKAELQDRGEYGVPDPDEIKPINMIVITDGVPNDDLDRVLVRIAQKLDALDAPLYQVGVQFFQVGSEPEAADYLRHLDDNLGKDIPGGIRDMVDTVTWDAYRSRSRSGSGAAAGQRAALGLSADGVLKAVLGAVVKRLDSQPTIPSPAPANVASPRRFLSPTA